MEIITRKEYGQKMMSFNDIYSDATWPKLTIEQKMHLVWHFYALEIGKQPTMTEFLKLAFNTIKKFIAGEIPGKSWMLFSGRCGCGKTALAKALCKAYNFGFRTSIVVEKINPQWKMKNALEVVRAMQMQEEDTMFDTILNSRRLMIDDIGTEPETQNVYGTKRNAIMEVLSYRYEKKLPTIITTNLPLHDGNGLKGIEGRYGIRIVDRINEKAVKIPFVGESFRK